MSKKFGKFLLFTAVAGAAAYGAYHYLQNKEDPSSGKEEDTDDDFDDFSEDLDDDTEENKERSYVALNLDKAEAIATEAFQKAKEVIADSVQQVKDTVKAVAENQAVSESNFTDLTAINKSKAEEEKTPEDTRTPEEDNSSAQALASAPEEKVEEFFDDEP